MQVLTDAAQAAELCRSWQTLPFVALDTEFMRSNTYFAELGLLQIRAAEQTVLFDPTVDGMAAALAPLLCGADTCKVLHAGSEDLQILAQYLGAPVRPVFDTQLAAALCGHGFSLSYSRLVEILCGEVLDKGETRSDWLQRPLTEKQIRYAAEDVAHLPALFAHLSAELADLQRADWMNAECRELERVGAEQPAPEAAYLKISRAWQLQGEQLLALQKLTAFREKVAIARNRPRSWILKDKVLWQLAKTLPGSTAELARIEDLPAAQLRRHGESILAIISDAQAAEAVSWPQPLAQPPGKPYSKLAKILRSSVNARAEELNMPPEMLARKKDLEHLMASHSSTGLAELSPALSGWRADVIGWHLQAQVQEHFTTVQQSGGNG